MFLTMIKTHWSNFGARGANYIAFRVKTQSCRCVESKNYIAFRLLHNV